MMINAWCYPRGESTWTIHAVHFFRALHKRRAVAIVPLESPGPLEELPADLAEMIRNGRRADARDPSIAIAAFEALRHVRGSRRIAFAVWETTVMRAPDVAALRQMDEIWTPSQFGRRVLITNGLDAERIHVVPEGVDPEVFRPRETPRGEGPFRFLCVGKWEQRKATDLLVDAFCEEFAAAEPVELVMHCWNPWVPSFDLEASVTRARRGRTTRVVASRPVPGERLADLYNEADAFVLPTRAEGWGLPIVEAMACGLPVIVTNYSAPADYLDDVIAYPIRVEKLVDVYDPFFFPEGSAAGQWAQPDVAHLRSLLRHVYEHPAEAREKGRRAREVVCSRWTWDHAAAKACEVLGA
jgi:glycosyltransferase involved in cell wall biosynthesis